MKRQTHQSKIIYTLFIHVAQTIVNKQCVKSWEKVYNPIWIESTVTAESTRVSLSEAAWSIVAFWGRFDTACIFWAGSWTSPWLVCFRVRPSQNEISTERTELCLSSHPSQCTLHVNGMTLQQMDKFETSILGWFSRLNEQGDWPPDRYSKRASAWASWICGRKTGAFKQYKSVSFEIGLPIFTYGRAGLRGEQRGQLPRAPRWKGPSRWNLFASNKILVWKNPWFRSDTRIQLYIIFLCCVKYQGPPTAIDFSTSLTVCQS